MNSYFNNPPIFELEDLVGRLLHIESFTEGAAKIIVAYDVRTLEIFVLKVDCTLSINCEVADDSTT